MINRKVLKGAVVAAAMAFAGSVMAAPSYGDLNNLDNDLSAGVASSVAVASLPGAYRANQSALSFGTGYYGSEGAVAAGLSTVTESGTYVLDFNVSVNSQSDAAVGAGVAVTW